jgi:hypothetical protein
MRSFLIVVSSALVACAPQQTAAPATAASAESKIEVCVIDPVVPGGMMTVAATHVHATGDTLVMQSEGRVPIARLVAGPKILTEATWITPRTPLQLAAESGRVTFAMNTQPRIFAPGKIVLLGVMRGLPLYVLPAEGGAMRPEVEAMAARGVDLEKALQQSRTLRRQLDRVKTIYAPVSLTGCAFQQFSKVQRRR